MITISDILLPITFFAVVFFYYRRKQRQKIACGVVIDWLDRAEWACTGFAIWLALALIGTGLCRIAGAVLAAL